MDAPTPYVMGAPLLRILPKPSSVMVPTHP